MFYETVEMFINKESQCVSSPNTLQKGAVNFSLHPPPTPKGEYIISIDNQLMIVATKYSPLGVGGGCSGFSSELNYPLEGIGERAYTNEQISYFYLQTILA